jgi:hypothetical protein
MKFIRGAAGLIATTVLAALILGVALGTAAAAPDRHAHKAVHRIHLAALTVSVHGLALGGSPGALPRLRQPDRRSSSCVLPATGRVRQPRGADRCACERNPSRAWFSAGKKRRSSVETMAAVQPPAAAGPHCRS